MRRAAFMPFRWALGSYLSLLVLLPLAALVVYAFSDGLGAFWASVSTPTARAALWLTLWTSALVGLIHLPLGTLTAWVLVRYRFPGRALLSALVDLPLSIPTLVAGVMLAVLYGPGSLVGTQLTAWGVPVVFAQPGVLLALLLVTLPFVVRAVEPLLEELDPAEEEAAQVLGASPLRTFKTVHLPALFPAALSAAARSMGRCIGEFGSVVVISGNVPLATLTAPVHVFAELESGAPSAAAAVSVVLLAVALALHGFASAVIALRGARHAH